MGAVKDPQMVGLWRWVSHITIHYIHMFLYDTICIPFGNQRWQWTIPELNGGFTARETHL